MNTVNSNRKRFSIYEAFAKSFKLMYTNWWIILRNIMILPVVAVIILIFKCVFPFAIAQIITNICQMILIASAIFAVIGLNRVFLQIYDNKIVPLRPIFPPIRILFKYICGTILNGLLMMLGGILLVIPGLVIFTAYSFFYLFYFDNPKTGIWEAFRLSSRLAKGVGFKLFFFSYIANIIFIFFSGLNYLLFVGILLPEILKDTDQYDFNSIILLYCISVFLYSLFKLAQIHIYRKLQKFEATAEVEQAQEQVANN